MSTVGESLWVFKSFVEGQEMRPEPTTEKTSYIKIMWRGWNRETTSQTENTPQYADFSDFFFFFSLLMKRGHSGEMIFIYLSSNCEGDEQKKEFTSLHILMEIDKTTWWFLSVSSQSEQEEKLTQTWKWPSPNSKLEWWRQTGPEIYSETEEGLNRSDETWKGQRSSKFLSVNQIWMNNLQK